MIEDVECLGTELKLHAFHDLEFAAKREVLLPCSELANLVAPERSERRSGWRAERAFGGESVGDAARRGRGTAGRDLLSRGRNSDVQAATSWKSRVVHVHRHARNNV